MNKYKLILNINENLNNLTERQLEILDEGIGDLVKKAAAAARSKIKPMVQAGNKAAHDIVRSGKKSAKHAVLKGKQFIRNANTAREFANNPREITNKVLSRTK